MRWPATRLNLTWHAVLTYHLGKLTATYLCEHQLEGVERGYVLQIRYVICSVLRNKIYLQIFTSIQEPNFLPYLCQLSICYKFHVSFQLIGNVVKLGLSTWNLIIYTVPPVLLMCTVLRRWPKLTHHKVKKKLPKTDLCLHHYVQERHRESDYGKNKLIFYLPLTTCLTMCPPCERWHLLR